MRVLTLKDGPSSHEDIAAKLASTGSVFFWMAAPTPPVYKYKLTKFVSYYRFSQNFKTGSEKLQNLTPGESDANLCWI